MTTDPDDRIKALLIESIDAELGPRPDVGARADSRDEYLPDSRPERRRGFARVAPFAAAAAVAAVGVTIAVAVSSSSDSPSPAGGPDSHGVPGAQVTCTGAAGASVAADQEALQARAAKLAHGGDVSSQVYGSAISIMVPGATRVDVAGLCLSTSVQLRPLVAPAVRVDAPPDDPGAIPGLDFSLPTDEAAYDRLTSVQQSQLADALGATDCARASVTAEPVVACDISASGHGRMAMLLGRPVVDGTHVATARAKAPDVAGGSPQWTVELGFDRTGTAAWSRYTSAHNLGSGPSDFGFTQPSTCVSTKTPCADYVGFVVDGAVVSLPVNESAITGGTTQISGQFDAASAKRLAADLRAGQLPVPVTRTSTIITK